MEEVLGLRFTFSKNCTRLPKNKATHYWIKLYNLCFHLVFIMDLEILEKDGHWN